MDIRMLKDFPVAPNGFDTENWPKGSEHFNIDDALGDDLVSAKVAEEIKPEAEKKAPPPKA